MDVHAFQVLGFTARFIKMSMKRQTRWYDFLSTNRAKMNLWDFLLCACFILSYILKFIAYGMAKNEVGSGLSLKLTILEYV